VAGHHVAAETDRVAERAHEVGDQLDHREDRAQDQRRRGNPEHARKPDALAVEADEGDGQEHQQRNTAVTAICEVVVKDIGIRPSMFDRKTNMKSVMT
jgi:hypothetical protein